MFSAVYITDFNDWEKCALSIKTLRVFHSNSSLPIYILGLGKLNDITKEKIEQVKDLNVTYVDVQSVLDKLFPFFKKFGKSNVVLVPTGGKYPLHEFSRLVIPYVNELHQYSKVLYLDNDMVVCDYLDKLFEECNEQCLNVVYSGRSCSMDNKNVIELYKDYDFWNTAYEYTCDSPLLFNMDMNFRKKYDEFIEHVNSAEEKYFLRKNEFFCSQEAVSLYGQYEKTAGKKCTDLPSKQGHIGKDTCIYHYWPIKGSQNFKEELIKILAKANKLLPIHAINQEISN